MKIYNQMKLFNRASLSNNKMIITNNLTNHLILIKKHKSYKKIIPMSKWIHPNKTKYNRKNNHLKIISEFKQK